jgi:GntR family transcriptional repressor for pyruvate dehydrogenase complex
MFRQRTTRTELLEQHRAINDALMERDPQAARQAVEQHLLYVESALKSAAKAQNNEVIAQQRYEHEQGRK